MSEFIEQEFASLDLGDKRRNKRLRQVLSRFLESPKRSIQATCSGWAELIAAYRLFNRKAATLSAFLKPHQSVLVEGDSKALMTMAAYIDYGYTEAAPENGAKDSSEDGKLFPQHTGRISSLIATK